MSPAEALAIFAVGLTAGTINTIVGSGSLITFPTLLAFGYSPVVANVTNTVGIVPGSVSGAVGYRKELSGQRSRLVFLGIASALGGVAGGVLLLVLPGSVFRGVVPILILVACAMVAAQPALARLLARRRAAADTAAPAHGGAALFATVFVTGVYGGYFGAAQGVILIALLGIFLDDDLQRLNAAKNVLAALVNGIAAVLFVVASATGLTAAHVAWNAAALLAGGAVIGGQAGAKLGRRLPAPLLRGIIVVVGTAVAIRLLF